jgi:uncharacterized damage-inducible protein DinB
MNRPLADEYPDYYNQYINLVKVGDIISILEEQSTFVQGFLTGIPEDLGDKTYAFGKWTLKETLGHMIDTERIMAYRFLRIVRGDKQQLPGFDQDEYVLHGKFFRRTIKDLIDEKLLVRASNLILFRAADQDDLLLRGSFNDIEISGRAILYIVAGHELHHIDFIKENYLDS